jgi:hypothetical protein
MFKLCPSLLALACIAAPALAQVNPFIVYPQDPERQTITCTSYVGRPDQARAAEALIALSENDYRGIGDANGVMRIFGVYVRDLRPRAAQGDGDRRARHDAERSAAAH